jgi:hypothetical protein
MISSDFPAKVPTMNANYVSHIDLYFIALDLVYQTARCPVPKVYKLYIPRRVKKSHPIIHVSSFLSITDQVSHP